MTKIRAEKREGLARFYTSFLLKFMIVVLFILLAFGIGLVVGYAVVGDGQSWLDVFSAEKWSKIFQLIQ